MSLSVCLCFHCKSHMMQLMKAQRTAKYCAVQFSFLLLLAGLHENGDSAVVLRNGSFVLMNGLVFLPTSHFLPPLSF